MATVYLAGAMTGLTKQEINEWRNTASAELLARGFKVLNPVNTELSNEPDSREIVGVNKYQIRNSDIILAEFDRPGLISIGTIGEIIFAYGLGKPVITWGSQLIVNHPWIEEHTTKRFIDLTNAVNYIIRNYRLKE